MTGPLKKLVVSHLRGATTPFTLTFEAGKKLTLIYGENGSGKSTICDALEFLAGRLTSLDDRGLGNSTVRYWHSVGKLSGDISVALEVASQTITATLEKSDVIVKPADVRFRMEILRRRQISRLVAAPAAERYNAIRRFVDVSGIEASESGLRDLAATLKREKDTAVVRVAENDAFIREVWMKNGSNSGDAISWAREASKSDEEQGPGEDAALSHLGSLYTILADYPRRMLELRAAADVAISFADAAATQVVTAARQMESAASELVGVLRAVDEYLERWPNGAACPACESGERIVGLRERVTERLAELSVLDSAKQTLASTEGQAERARANMNDLASRLAEDVASFVAYRDGRQWSPEANVPASDPPLDLDALESWLRDTAQVVDSWNDIAVARLDRRRFVEALQSALSMFDENNRRAHELGILLPRVEQAHQSVIAERRAFTDTVLSEIATEVGRLYECVHPGEGLNKISLALDPKRRASLEIDANFLGNERPPQAYFSDSHLDTLGLCLFLAISARDRAAEVVLVLDDVLTSVDEPHVERLIDMVYQETLKFRHCLLTTHYRPWKEKLRWGWLRHGQCQFVELGPWSAANGIATVKMLPEVEKLRSLLAQIPPDVQAICAKAGVVLEATLDFLTQLYECPIPRRSGGRYTLGDLLPSIDKKLRNAMLVEVLMSPTLTGGPAGYVTVQMGPMLEEITRIAQVRNVLGCHFSDLTFELLDSDGVLFGNKVLALVDALVDKDVGWPKSNKSGRYWATSGETRRLHPLQQPK